MLFKLRDGKYDFIWEELTVYFEVYCYNRRSGMDAVQRWKHETIIKFKTLFKISIFREYMTEPRQFDLISMWTIATERG